MPGYRNGQWVKFKNEVPGAHTTPDGWTVGIFQRGAVDGLGQAAPDRIMVCCPKGNNIAFVDDEGQVKNRTLAPAAAVDLSPVLSTDHIPGSRLSTARDGFVPKA
jgi:hypothetical protein